MPHVNAAGQLIVIQQAFTDSFGKFKSRKNEEIGENNNSQWK
jgi:hypothetical protein